MGRGTYTTASVIFFTEVVGLSVRNVGVALSCAGAAAVLAGLAAGWLADCHGSRLIGCGLILCQLVLVAVLPTADSFAALLPLVVCLGATDRGIAVVRRALVSHVMGAGDRVRTQAYLRSTANVSMSAGALAAAPALTVGSRSAFTVLCLCVAACYLVAAIATIRLPGGSRLESGASEDAGADSPVRPGARLRPVLGYVALGLVNGVLALHVSILDVALPLWVTRHLGAPGWVVAVLIFVNTILAVAFQVLFSRGAERVRGAAVALAASALCTAGACVLLATTSARSGAMLLVLLLTATAVLTMGELLQSAGEWGLSFGLAPAHAQGRYLGAFSVGTALQEGFGPIVVVTVAFTAVHSGPASTGWLGMAALILVSGALVIPLRRTAEAGQPTGDVR